MTGAVVLLGVGNRLRGDDAAGCLLVDELAGLDSAHVMDCDATPENFLQPVARLAPAAILILDCCDFGGRPGEFRLFDRSQVAELSYGLLSTHTLPLHPFIELLVRETGAEVSLLGIQPQHIEFASGLSDSVRAALPAAAGFIRDWVAGASQACCPE